VNRVHSSGDTADFAFVRTVGEAFVNVYPRLVAPRKDTPFDEAARERLLLKRGRFVEFNLVDDCGTKFGFQTETAPAQPGVSCSFSPASSPAQ